MEGRSREETLKVMRPKLMMIPDRRLRECLIRALMRDGPAQISDTAGTIYKGAIVDLELVKKQMDHMSDHHMAAYVMGGTLAVSDEDKKLLDRQAEIVAVAESISEICKEFIAKFKTWEDEWLDHIESTAPELPAEPEADKDTDADGNVYKVI